MTTTTTATTMEYDNEDEWLIHCGSLLGVLSSSSVTSGMEFTGVDDDDDDAGDDDHNNCSVHHPHPKSDEEEFIKEVDDNVGFFDEGDFIGCYVSYDKHEDDVAWNDHDDNNNEDTLLPCPPLSDPATAALHFHTPTTTTTSGRHDQTTTTTTNTVTTKPKRKRTRRDPQKPKGWLTPVLLYSNANRARVKLENPNKSFGDVVSNGPRTTFFLIDIHCYYLMTQNKSLSILNPSLLMMFYHRPAFSPRNLRISPPKMQQRGEMCRKRTRHVTIVR